MISPLLAARQTALGGGVCQIVAAATWKAAGPGVTTIEPNVNARNTHAQAIASASAKPSAGPEADACSAEAQNSPYPSLGEGVTAEISNTVSAAPSSFSCANWSQLRQRPSPAAGGLAGLVRRLPSSTQASAPVSSWAADGRIHLHRCLHTSPVASGAAAVSAVAAAAAAAAAAEAEADRRPAAATAAAGRGRRQQQPLSPHAYEFQRRFFQLVNSGSAAAMASADGTDAASEAVAHTTHSQAIRMLVAWLEEGRATAAAEYEQQRAAATAAAASAAESPPPAPAPGSVAAPYRLDQQIIDRAMEVLWRLYHREGVVTRGARNGARGAPSASSASASSSTSSPAGPMELAELLNAAEVLAAAAPAMGLNFKKQHYELLIELYGKRALQDPTSRRGLAQRLLAVRQQVMQQLLPLSQPCLNTLLQGVRTDPLLNNPTKLTWAIRLIERDLPVVPAAVSSSSPASARGSTASAAGSTCGGGADVNGGITPPLQQTLGFMLRMAAREADWSAYSKLEAALVCRTRAPPPYEVLLDALAAASAAGGPASRLALGFLAQIEQLEAKRPPPAARQRPQQQQQHAQQQASQAAAEQQQQQESASSSQQHQQSEQQRREARDREARQHFVAEQARRSEVEGERRLDTELRSLRQLVAGGAAMGEEALAIKSYDRLRRLFWRDHPAVAAAAAEVAAATATAKDPPAKGPQEDEEEGSGGGQEERKAAAAAAVVLEAARLCPAPPDATLELLSLSLARRDWPAVLDHVTALAELQSLVQRSGGRVGRLLMGNPNRLASRTSAYGGLGPLSELLIGSEDDTVAYYTELLRRVAAAAASGAAAPFGGSPVPFGPPLRAAASRADLASVSGIVRQMRGLQCGPGADSYAAVVEASLRAGKPERVAGLLDLMVEEEGLFPTAPLWEVQLRAAAEAGDTPGLAAVAERALSLAEAHPQCGEGLARISGQVLAEASTVAEARADGRAASALKLLRLCGEELRNAAREEWNAAREERWLMGGDQRREDRRTAGATAMRRAALQLQQGQREQGQREQWRQRPQQQGQWREREHQ